jgi:hypothetical protein
MTTNVVTLILSIIAIVLAAMALGAVAFLAGPPATGVRHRRDTGPEPGPGAGRELEFAEPLVPVYDLAKRQPPVPAFHEQDQQPIMCGARPAGRDAPDHWLCTRPAGHYPHTYHETDSGNVWADEWVWSTPVYSSLGPPAEREHVHEFGPYGPSACWCGWGEPKQVRPYVTAPPPPTGPAPAPVTGEPV